MKFRQLPIVIEAHQWHKNGDHPEDFSERGRGGLTEGRVVRYYQHPGYPSNTICVECGQTMNRHGWIDTLEQGHRVCPGDWIITGVKGERYPCKPDIFAATYEPVE